MKRLLTLIGLMCAATIGFSQHTGHPRLLFGPADIATITARIQVSGSAAQQLYELVSNTATHYRTNYLFNGDNIPLPSEDPWYKSAQYHNVLSLAFRYLVDPSPNTADRDRAKLFLFNPTNYGLDIDERFRQQGIVFDDWITYRNQGGDLGRQLSQQVICLALLYDWLYSELDSTQRQLIRDRIIANINYQYNWFGFNAGIRGILVPPRPDRNRMRLEHPPLALMIGAMSIYGEAGSSYSTAQADADIAAAIQAEFTETESHINRYFSPYDGAEADGISYGMWMLHILVTELELWSRWTGQNHWNDQNVSDRFSRIGQWLAYELLPEPHTSPCWFNTFSDAYSSMYSPLGLLLVLSTKYPGDSTAGINQWVLEHSVDSIRYVIQTSRAGHSPSNDQETQSNSMCYILPIIAGYQSVPAVEPTTVLPLSRHFTWNNLIYLRTSTTSWNGADDIQFGLTAGTDYHPLFHHHNWHHDQPDKGHFTLSAFNQLFIRSIGTDGRRSEYHNEVLIDGKGQVTTVLNTDHSKGWQGQNRGVITEFTSSPRFDFVDCDATDSYGALHWGIGLSNEVIYTRDDAGQNEKSEFNPVDHAHRYVSFSRGSDGVPPYFVMADDIKKDANPHNYTWRVFTSKPKFTISGNEFHLKDNAGSQILLDVYYACASPVTTSVIQLPQMQMAQVPIFDPYSACGTAWNTICDNPLAVDAVTTTNVVNPYFHVVMLPRKAGDLVPTYVTTSTSTGSIITVTWPAPNNFIDYSIFNTSGLDFVTDAKLSRVRVAPGSVISSFQMAQGTMLSKNGVELVNLYGCPGTVTRAGSRVDVAGATVGLFRVYVPGATTVMLNGVSVASEQVGNYVMSTLLATLAQQNKSYSSQSTSFNGQRKLYRESAGKLHEVFASGLVTQGEVFYRNSTDGGTSWTNTIRLSDGTMTSLAPCITMGSSTNVIVTWQQTNGSNYNVVFRRSTNGGTAWGSITTLQSNFSCGSPGPLPSVSGNTQTGRVVVTYRSSSGLRYVASSNNMTSWTAPAGVPGSTSGNHNSPSTAYYANDVNNCNLAFATDVGYSSVINYSSYSGSWSAVTNLSSVIPSSYQQHRNPTVATTSSVSPPLCHVAWEATDVPGGSTPVIIHRKGTSGNFGSQFSVINSQRAMNPSIAGLGGDNAWMVFQNTQMGRVDRVRYSYVAPQWVWGTPSAGPTGNYGQISTGSSTAKYLYTSGTATSYTVSLGSETLTKEDALVAQYSRELNLIDAEAGASLTLEIEQAEIIHKDGTTRQVPFTDPPADSVLIPVEEILTYGTTKPFAFSSLADTLRVRYTVRSVKAEEMVAAGDAEAAYTFTLRERKTGEVLSTLKAVPVAKSADMTSTAGEVALSGIQIQGLEPGAELTLEVSFSGVKEEGVGLIASLGHIYRYKGEGAEELPKPVAEEDTGPRSYLLQQNYPNPFNPSTTLRYGLPEAAQVRLIVYNTLGQQVADLVEGQKTAGYHEVRWEAAGLASGIYFARLTVTGSLGTVLTQQTTKLVLMR